MDIQINCSPEVCEAISEGLESLNSDPTLISMVLGLIEYDEADECARITVESIENDEDYSADIEEVLEYLGSHPEADIANGSKFEIINRSTITSISYVMEDNTWNNYQNIDREYGYGSFDDEESDDW